MKVREVRIWHVFFVIPFLALVSTGAFWLGMDRWPGLDAFRAENLYPFLTYLIGICTLCLWCFILGSRLAARRVQRILAAKIDAGKIVLKE